MKFLNGVRKNRKKISVKPGFNHTRSGFTLIELLVVISIISLLSSVILASVNNARKRGVDAAVVQDARQLSNAVELYYLTNKSYPLDSYLSEWTDGNPPNTYDFGNFVNNLKPYMSKVPTIRFSAAPYASFGYVNNDQIIYDGYIMNCGSTVSSGTGLPKYVIYFSSNLPLNLPYAYYHETTGFQAYMDGTNGTIRYYCMTSK